MGSIVIVPKNESITVEHVGNTVLIADIKCHQKLLQYRNPSNNIMWKFVLPIAGSELPIFSYATFHDKISRGLQNDKSSVESFPIPAGNMRARFTKHQISQAHKLISGNVETLQFELFYS